MAKNPPVDAGDAKDSISGSVRYYGEEHGNPLQYASMENPKDTGVWWTAAHRVAELDTAKHKHIHIHFRQKILWGKSWGVLGSVEAEAILDLLPWNTPSKLWLIQKLRVSDMQEDGTKISRCHLKRYGKVAARTQKCLQDMEGAVLLLM